MVDAARKLADAARTARRPFEPIEVALLGQLLEVLRANWPDYRQAVHATWPEGRGAEAAQALDPLLLPDTPQDASRHKERA